MKIRIFAVRDAAAEAYLQPICFPTRAVAIRSWTKQVASPDSPFSNRPEDYDLYELGEYDEDNGLLIPFSAPQFVIKAVDLINSTPAVQSADGTYPIGGY